MPRRCLVFRLGEDAYALDVLRVQEIRAYEPPAALPDAPDWVRGVISLRGAIVPIIDARARLGLSAAEDTRFAVIIVLDLLELCAGLLVDAASDVIELDPDRMHAAPVLAGAGRDSPVLGIYQLDERPIPLIDVRALLTGARLGQFAV
ncbi:MAG: chemotaxis protein CheW [Burkholderiales bacterium]|nr:MAG: chemotaxis protein CheW [Burkholderiales bacterium]